MSVSKTRMLALVQDLAAKEIAAALADSPDLIDHRDKQGRNWLHLCCGLNPKGRKLSATKRGKTAAVLLDVGLDIEREAFREGQWRATPLWYAIARGQCLPTARFLLARGATPDHCLWAAAYLENVPAIELLAGHGAEIDPVHDGQTPFLHAIQWSRFRSAKALLGLGADPDFQDDKGRTALHYMLKKDSALPHFRMLLASGARGDIPDATGATAAEILGRKRTPALRDLATRLPRA